MTIKAIGTRKDYVDADLEFIPIMTAGTKRLEKLPEIKEGHHVICQQENFFNDDKPCIFAKLFRICRHYLINIMLDS